MKKVLSVLTGLLLALVLVACGPEVQPVDGSVAKLETAYQSMSVLIADPSNITANFVVPTKLAGGVTAAWSSDEPGVVAFGAPAADQSTATVNRPAKGQGDATVKITATLSLKSELSDEILTREWNLNITVKENTVEEITIETIADILAITDASYDGGTYQVEIPNVTVFARGDVFFAYDGTGIIQLFQSQTEFEVGKVYDITGSLEWYFGIWELVKSTGVEKTTATPQYPTKEVVTSIDAKINSLVTNGEHLYANVADGNFEPVYATITGKVYMIPGDNGNYNTYIIDSSKSELTLGTSTVPASGLMVYYNTRDFQYIRSFNGFEVTMDVVIYTYRSNNLAYAIYYVGGPTGIVATLNDQQKVDLAKTALVLAPEVYEEGKTLNLVSKGLNDVNVSWAFKDANDPNNALVNLTTGAVTLPASGPRQDVVLVATITSGAVTDTKEITVKVGEFPLSTIAEVNAATSNTLKFRVSGTVLGYNGHRQISIADATGAVTLYMPSVDAAAELRLLVGKQVQVIGLRAVFNGLIQLTNPVVLDLEADGVIPASVDLRTVELWDAASLLPYQAGKVSVTNLKVTAVGTNDFGNVDLTLEDEVTLKTIKFFWDSRQPLVGSSDFIKGLAVGDYVSFENALLTWRSNNPVLAIDDAAQAVEGESPVLTDAEELALDKALLDVATTVTASLELPLTLANGTTVVWTSSLPEVLGNDGVYGEPTVDTEVTLTATLTNGEETDTKVFVLNVKAFGAVETVAYTFDFGTAPKTGYGAGDLVFSNVNGDPFTLDKDRVQINTTTFAPLDAQGAFLVLAPVSTTKVSYVVFDFTGAQYAGATRIEFSFVAWSPTAHDNAVALEGNSIRIEKLVGENWVAVGDNVFSQLTKTTLVTASFDIEGQGQYRIVYETPNATASSNTSYAVCIDDLKIYVL